MADLSITAGSVLPGSGSTTEFGTAGETITAGQVVYLKSSDSEMYKADSNHATAENRTVYGIALNGASGGQPLKVLTKGNITIGATTAVGTIYILSATAGGIAPAAPGTTGLASGMYTSIIGIATTTGIINVQIHNGAVAVP